MRAKTILLGTGGMLLVLAAVIVIAVHSIDPAAHLPVAVAKVKELTGRDLRVDGGIGFTFSLVPKLSIEGVRFQNASWGSRPEMLSAKRVEVEIALLPLLSGRIDIRGLTLIEPDILLERNNEGRGNWQFDAADAKPQSSAAEPASQGIEIRRAHVERGSLTYRNASDRKERKLEIVDLDMKDSGGRMQIDLSGRVDGEGLEVKVAIKRDATPADVDLTLKSAGMTLTVETAIGAASKSAVPDGKFDLDVREWGSVGKLVGAGPIKLPALKASGKLKSADGTWIVDDLKAALGKSNFAGTIRLRTDAAASALDVKLESTLVDLAELQGPHKKEAHKDGRMFSAETLPIEPLKNITGRIEARIARLALKDGKAVDGVELLAVADRGRIRADPVRLMIGGRELRIRAILDASSGKTLGAELAIHGTGISLGALSALLNLSGTPEGSPTDIDIRFNGQGHSMRTLMANANGDVRLVIGPGRMKNRAIDWGADVTELLNAINPARASEPYTELKCAVARLPIRQGVIRVENGIAAETSKVVVIAAGVIDLRTEVLDLGFRPKAATGLGLGIGSLASLGRLRGSFTHPTVELDMAGTAKTAAQLGLAAATGGLSLLASGLLSDNVPDRPCQAALTGTMRAQAKPAQEQPPSVVEDVVGGIKKLFGR